MPAAVYGRFTAEQVLVLAQGSLWDRETVLEQERLPANAGEKNYAKSTQHHSIWVSRYFISFRTSAATRCLAR